MDSPVAISVIVPIYNVDRFLDQCLSSLQTQSFSSFEVLMVDDGSPDSSAKIACRYSKADPRFILLQKSNGGVASARNHGLMHARGEYIAFVDGDDLVAPNYLSVLYQNAAANNADVVCCNYYMYSPKSGKRSAYPLAVSPGIYSSEYCLKSALHDFRMQSYTWNKLWRRQLFEDYGIRFPLIRFEDTATVMQLLYFANKIVVVPDALYYYSQRNDSIVHTFRPEVSNDFLRSFALLRLFLDKQSSFATYRPHFLFYTLKSLFFIWSVIFLYHFQEKCFGGFGANCSRATAFLRLYSRKLPLSPTGQPDYRTIIRPAEKKPSRRQLRRRLSE